MSKSASIPLSLSELKRPSLQRLSFQTRKTRELRENQLSGFVVLVETLEDNVRLYGLSADRAGVAEADEIVAVNDVEVEGKDHSQVLEFMNKCIRSKVVQLRVRRKSIAIEAKPEPSSGTGITDAYLVSVDKDHITEVSRVLRLEYPHLRIFDMESIAAGTSSDSPPVSGNSIDSMKDSDRLKHYEEEMKQRMNSRVSRQKENDLLRSSLRSSKRLKALSTNENSPESTDSPRLNGYQNVCFESTLDRKEDNNNDEIPLKEVQVSVDRIADVLSRNGREEDLQVLRDFFRAAPVQEAITAVHRSQTDHHEVETNLEDQQPQSSKGDEAEANQLIKEVIVNKDEDSYLGATVREDENRIVIARVVRGGVVQKTGIFNQGDELIEMNGICLQGKKVSEVCDIMRNTCGEIRFLVGSQNKKQELRKPSHIQNLRALFDYDPEDDPFVPCRELALRFERGDILHVMSTEDENWWQAIREGEEDQPLAGLIPSTNFRQQVITFHEEMDRESRPKNIKEKACKLPGVIRSLGRKQAKEIHRSLDEPATVQSHTELLCYEEVVLSISRSNHRRPLIFCGPEGVGCLLLRQRLLETDPQRLASPIPYTTRPAREGEISGVHYHFIPRQLFQEYAKSGKFVEYGEYQKHWYGTGVQDILNVIRKGKTCVMTLKPESLSTVKIAEVQPFIVLVAPPSLAALRRQRQVQGVQNISDDVLKKILEQGKYIEQKFGHLFDKIIVNTDPAKSLEELKNLLSRLDTEPHWVPSHWLAPSRL